MYVHVPKNCLEFRQFGTSVKGRNAYFFRLVRWWWQSLLSYYIFQLRLTWKYFFEKFRNMILYHKKFYILYKWSIGLNFDFQLMTNNHWLLSIWFLMQFFTNKNVSWINKNKTERYGKHCIFTGDFKVLHVKS